MKIYLIRHGETTGDLEDRYGGDYDDHLTDRGKQQAFELSEKLRDKKLDMIFHSPRIRAVETAEIVEQNIDVPKKVVKNLRERNCYGILTGMVKSEAAEQHPHEVEKLQRDKLNHDVECSENYEAFIERVTNVFDDEILPCGLNSIAIITHGGVISCFIKEYLQIGECASIADCGMLEILTNGEDIIIKKEDGIVIK